jgi:iron complex transport system ATP-binding protein
MTLTADRISVTLGSRPILGGVSVSVAAGELVALLGPNGCGKTTLLRAVAGVQACAGTLSLDGAAYDVIGPAALAKRIAYLPQSPTVPAGLRVRELLLLGRLPHRNVLGLETRRDQQIAAAVAADLELTDLLGRPLDTLSGGQRQRAFIARCLVQEPSVLLLDEPATYLDLRHQVDLLALLRRLATEKQLAILMASHDLNLTATHCDRMVLMDGGAVVSEGPPDTVLDPAVLQSVFGVPMKRVNVDGVAMVVPSAG